ncbi:MAG: asparagine--tRNA ligase [Corallococcus sp.]|nr:asparagine--tRNA ligase [Corallococcus sp.]MCM1358934.1 asparagine--tRNA ligase [Corallococcus sp.]MCM1394922.1 asparagine--tRNA ligase [Corallococcus sp.]
MKHIDIKQIVCSPERYFDQPVTVCGWVRSFRDGKNMGFLALNDGTTLNHLQIVIDKNVCTQDLSAVRVGGSVKVSGIAVKSFNANQAVEVNAHEIEVLGDCPLDYPIQKAKTSLDFLRTVPHLRVRTNTFNAVFRVRSKLSAAIHRFFQERDFTYVHTPIITGSDCEGAGEIFQVTTVGFDPTVKTAEEYAAKDFFGQSAGLTVSGQLEGEVMAMAFGKIYTFGPTFRAENSNTTRHAAEFWQIEPEVAFAELSDIIEIATDFIKYIINDILHTCADELAFLEKFYEAGLTAKLQKVVDDEFVKLEYTDAIKILQDSGREFQYPVAWGKDLQTEHERYLTDVVFNKPVFVVNYPKDIKSFYMKQNPDGKTVAATDLLVPGVGEIIGCSEREADYDKLMQAITTRNMKLSDYQNYLDLRKFGSVPHSGFGLGLERILMYATGMGNIRDTIAFPRTKNELR